MKKSLWFETFGISIQFFSPVSITTAIKVIIYELVYGYWWETRGTAPGDARQGVTPERNKIFYGQIYKE